MGLSKTNRIIILLVVDTIFFLIELIAGWCFACHFNDDNNILMAGQVMRFTLLPLLPILSTWYAKPPLRHVKSTKPDPNMQF